MAPTVVFKAVCMTFLLYLPLAINAQTYIDPATGLTWRLLNYPLQPTSAKVVNVYQQNYRPARWTELKALIDSNAANINQIVTQLGGDLGTVYNVTSRQWLRATLSTNANPSAMFNSSIPVDGGVYAVSTRTCNVNNSFPVNVPDIYDFNVTDNVIDACFCFSTWSGPSCTVPTTSTNCQNNSALIANAGQQTLAGGSQSGARLDTLTESVIYNISSPNLRDRNYTYFNWGSCDSNKTVNGGLSAFWLNTNPADCNDTWTFSWRVQDLEQLCGLERTVDPPERPNTVRYRGDLNIYFIEWAEINQNQRLRRTGRLVTPVDVYIDREATAELNTNTSINVWSTFEVKAAITATDVKTNSTTSYMDITIGIPAPYAVIQIAAGNPLQSVSNDPANPDVAWSCILQNKGQQAQSCTPVATWDNGSGLSDCIQPS